MNTKKSRILGVGVTMALLASLLVGALPVSANVTSATVTLTHATPSLADDISQAAVVYTATFSIGATIPAGGGIDVAFPAGTGNLAALTATMSASSGIGTGAFITVPTAVPTVIVGTTIRILVPAAGGGTGNAGDMNVSGSIGAGALAQVVITGVTNSGTTGTYTLGIDTTAEAVTVASASFTLVPPTIPGVPGIVNGKNAAGNVLVTLTGGNVISTVIGTVGVVTVEVGPGTYDETGVITVPAGKTVVSTSGPGTTLITDDGPGAPNGVGGNVLVTGGATAIFDGFTVTRGVTITAGGIVRNCVLSNTDAANVALTINGAAGVSTGNTISAGTGRTGLNVAAAATGTSTGDTYSVAATGTAITNNATLTLTGATVIGASGTGLTNAAGLATVTDSSFSNLNIAINATGGIVNISTSTIDACGFASATVPTGAFQIAGGVVGVMANTITNGPNAIARVAAGATGNGSSFKFNTLTGNVASFTAAVGALGVLDATNNWWGSSAGPTVASTPVRTLTSPWLIAEVTTPTVLYGAANVGTSHSAAQATSGVTVAMFTGAAPSANMNVIATGNYDGNPVTAAPPADTVKSFEVYIQGPAANMLTDSAIITFFGITNPLARVYAYSANQDTYVLCTTQRVDMFAGTVVVTVNGVNAVGLTSPNLGNMSGLEFVLTSPAVAPIGAPAQASLVPGQAAEDIRPTMTSFTWAAVAGATGYNFELAPYLASSQNPFIPAFILVSEDNLSTNGVILITTELEYLKTYAWRVQAVRGTEEGAWVTSFFTTEAEAEEAPDPIEIVIPEPTPAPEITVVVPEWTEIQVIPDYLLWVIIAVGAILIIAVIVLIVRTRRVA